MTRIDDFQVGSRGFLAKAYGRHVVAGHLAEHRVDTSGTNKQVYVSVLLGMGEWDGLDLVTYEGAVIAPGNYNFYPGIQNPTTADPYFPGSLKYNRISRYTAQLPDGMAQDDRPDKMKVIARTSRVSDYNPDGSVANLSIFSVNPADHFVDLIKTNCDRLGLNIVDYIDWDAYTSAWFYFATNIAQANYNKAPRNFQAFRVSGGSLADGTYFASVQAFDGAGYSLRAGETAITISGSNKTISISCDAVAGATSYRFWVKSGATYYRTDSASPSINITALGTSGTPSAPGGGFVINLPRFESHIAFPNPTSLTDALNKLMWTCCGDWQRVGKRYRILTPESRSSVHTFTTANTMPGSFNFWRTPRKERINRVTIDYRDITDSFLTPGVPQTIDRDDTQGRIGIQEEKVALDGMSPNQAFRIANFRLRTQHDLNQECELIDDGTAAHVLPCDLVQVTDTGAGWSNKKFKVIEVEDDDSDTQGNRKFYLREYDPAAYSETDSAPLTSATPDNLPSQFGAPPAVVSIALSQQNFIKSDGAVSLDINGVVTFDAFVTGQLGFLYHQKPGGSYEQIQVLAPVPATNTAGFRIVGSLTGVNNFKVVVVSDLGVTQTAAVVVYPITVVQYLIAPPRPPSMGGTRGNGIVRWAWTPVFDSNVKTYRISDGSDVMIAEVDTTEWSEPVPAAGSVVRRVRAVDTTGNASVDYREGVYNADYPDQRVVYNTPIGSSNFIANGADDQPYEETPVVGLLRSAAYNSDTDAIQRTDGLSNWSAGWRADRFFHAGNVSTQWTISYPTNSQQSVFLGFSAAMSGSVPDLTNLTYGVQIQSSFYSGTVANLVVVQNGSVVFTGGTWVQGDKVKVAIEGSQYKTYKNAVLVHTGSITPKFPLAHDVLQYTPATVTTTGAFVVKGIIEEAPRKAHWKNMVGMTLDANDNPKRNVSGSAWGASGAFSVEPIEGDGFVEFNSLDTATYTSGVAYAVGLSDSDPNQDIVNIDYGIICGTADALGAGSQGYFVIENNNFVAQGFSAGYNGNDKFRIAIEGGVVKYRRNGDLIYTSLVAPTAPRYYVDTAIQRSTAGNFIPNIRMGEAGASGRGWRIDPLGQAEFARGVKIGGTNVNAIRARAINAISDANRYRGNDLGTPLENRINASMFSLGTLRTFESDIYTELIVNIPDSVLEDGYANFDSVRFARTKVFNVFGDVVTECEQAFSGRGKVVIGMHTRDYADPIDLAVFSIEFKNAYGWSRPVYWTNAIGAAWGASWWNWTGNGTTSPPTWRVRTDFPTGALVNPIDSTSVKLIWNPTVTNTTGGTSFAVWHRVHQKGKNRSDWQLVAGSLSQATNNYTITGLSPNTEYEVIAHGGGGYQWSNFAYVRTYPTPPAALPTRAAPSGLVARAVSQTQVDLEWIRNATDNNNVEVYSNGGLLSTEAAGTTTKSVTGLTANTTYRFKVRNKWSSGTTYSDFTNEVEITTPANPPPVANDPSSLTAQVWGLGNQVKLDWNRNSGSNGRVEYSFDGATWFTAVSGLGTTVTYTHTVGYDTHVYYRVFNATGGSNYSNVIDLWTLPDVVDDPECVTPETLILVMEKGGSRDGVTHWKRADAVVEGDWLVNVSGGASKVKTVMNGSTSLLLCLTTENAEQLWCSPSHPMLAPGYPSGKPGVLFEVGDPILTFHGGVAEETTILSVESVATPKGARVITYELEGDHTFISAGIVSHNRKAYGVY